MNYRRWPRRLIANPVSFAYELITFAYEKYLHRNPTRPFGKGRLELTLELDLGRGQLNGISLGTELADLRPLGTADIALGNEPDVSLEYSPFGLCINFENRKLHSFEIFFDSVFIGMHPTKFVPCEEITIRRSDGEAFDVGYSTTADKLKTILGDPYDTSTARYTFGVESCLYYLVPTCRVVASFDDRSCRLMHLDISPRPVPRS